MSPHGWARNLIRRVGSPRQRTFGGNPFRPRSGHCWSADLDAEISQEIWSACAVDMERLSVQSVLRARDWIKRVAQLRAAIMTAPVLHRPNAELRQHLEQGPNSCSGSRLLAPRLR